ncbi:MAG: type II secretion system protein J [Phycisphaerales bacterium JB039]
MRPAFTLLEVLLATAMIAMVALGSTSLLQTIARARQRHETPMRWQAAADRTLGLIASDLHCADITITSEPVTATDGELRLASRADLGGAPAPVEIVYRLAADGRLHREIHPLQRQLGARGQPDSSSVVLGDVSAFLPRCDQAQSALLLVLRGPSSACERTVRLP